jgi:hypothetical protein
MVTDNNEPAKLQRIKVTHLPNSPPLPSLPYQYLKITKLSREILTPKASSKNTRSLKAKTAGMISRALNSMVAMRMDDLLAA